MAGRWRPAQGDFVVAVVLRLRKAPHVMPAGSDVRAEMYSPFPDEMVNLAV